MADDIAAEVTLDHLMLDGEPLDTEIHEAITEGSATRTLDAAPTLKLSTYGGRRTLLRSGLFSKRVTAQLDGRSYELAAIGSRGNLLDLTFEELVVAELRRHDSYRKADANTVTRVQFARMLLAETPWIPLNVSPTAKADLVKMELSRGEPAAEGTEARPENTWECLKRIFGEIEWRCYADAGAINVGPDYAFTDHGVYTTIREDDDRMASTFDFDWDVGKPMATATFTVFSKRWEYPPGTPIAVEGMGPADGVWMVSSVERNLFTVTSRVTVKRPEPDLPEPEPPNEVLEGEDFYDANGQRVSGGVAGKGGYIWPVSGSITSRFGKRGGRLHAGLDIGAPTGRPVVASRGGTVTTAGVSGGYGNAVYIKHGEGNSTRYGHLSRITCRRGQVVSAGQKIGEVGSTGNSTGPHLHFEIRINNKAVDPLGYL